MSDLGVFALSFQYEKVDNQGQKNLKQKTYILVRFNTQLTA